MDHDHEPTRAMDLDERCSGLRGQQHNPQDPGCRVASIFADGKGWNRCHICHPQPVGAVA